MSADPQQPPESLDVPLAALVELGVEHWRLSRWLAKFPADAERASAPARHALRRMDDFLRQRGLEISTLDGKPFEAGLAARVVDAEDDPALPEGSAVVAETLSPMVAWCGTVVRPADVVTRRGPNRR